MTFMETALKGISMPTFYKFGSILFFFGAIGGAINLKMQWATINIGGKISMFSSFIFQLLLLGLFITLYFQIRKQPKAPQKVVESPEIEAFLNDLKSDDTKDTNDTNDKKDTLKEMKGGSKQNGQKNNINN